MFSTIVGIDVVPRLSVKTLFKLRDQIITYFPQCKVSKWNLYTKFWNSANYATVFGTTGAARGSHSARVRQRAAAYCASRTRVRRPRSVLQT